MQEIYNNYGKEFGYKPSFIELWGLYTSGSLELTSDEQEDIIIEQAERLGIL